MAAGEAGVQAAPPRGDRRAAEGGLEGRELGDAGARRRTGGVDIPDPDREDVYRHLEHHYREFGKEPPAFDDLGA